MTLGDSRVGIDINPSGSKTIAEIKRRAADLMGAVDAIDLPGEAPGEIARLKALAMTEIESAVMWAVMAAARSEAASRLPGVAAADCDHAPVILRGGGLATSAALVGRDRARP